MFAAKKCLLASRFAVICAERWPRLICKDSVWSFIYPPFARSIALRYFFVQRYPKFNTAVRILVPYLPASVGP